MTHWTDGLVNERGEWKNEALRAEIRRRLSSDASVSAPGRDLRFPFSPDEFVKTRASVDTALLDLRAAVYWLNDAGLRCELARLSGCLRSLGRVIDGLEEKTEEGERCH